MSQTEYNTLETNRVIAIDFDGTIVTHEFPNIGKLIPGAKETIDALKENGHSVFLWTMRGYHPRHKRCLEEAVSWCEWVGINFDNINATTSGFHTSSHKQHANLYIDDAALGAPLQEYKGHVCMDWAKVAYELRRLNYITDEQFNSINNSIRETIAD